MPVLYLATGDGPIVVTQESGRWRAARPLELRSATAVAADPERPERVVCATAREGAWGSDDAGATWRRVFEGAPHDRLTALAVSGSERAGGRGVVYLGTEPSRVFRSEDGGASWRALPELTELPSAGSWSFPPRPDSHHVRWLEPDPHAPGRLYAAVEAGALLRSPDGGATWRDRVPGGPRDTHRLVVRPDAPGRLLSAAGDGVFESDDAGDSWHRAERGLRHRYAWSVALVPGAPGTALLTAATSARHAHDRDRAEAHLYRRAGDGEPWREVGEGPPAPGRTRAPVLAAGTAEQGVVYAGADGGLYRSSDAGASWERLRVEGADGWTATRVHALVAAG